MCCCSSRATPSARLGQFILGSGGPASVTAQGRLSLVDSLALDVAGQITAKGVTLSAASFVVSGLVGACVVGGAGGDITLTATGASGTIAIASGAVVGGQSSVTLSAPGGVAVAGGTIDSPTVDFAASVGGATDLTISATGGLVFGDPGDGHRRDTGERRPRCTHSILNAGTVGFGGGDLYAGNDLAIAPAATLSGAAATAGNLTVSGASTISAGAVLLAGGSITVTGTGDVAQTGGHRRRGRETSRSPRMAASARPAAPSPPVARSCCMVSARRERRSPSRERSRAPASSWSSPATAWPSSRRWAV